MVCCWECKYVVGVGGLGDGDEDPLVDKWGSDWGIWQWVFSYSQDKFLFHVFHVSSFVLERLHFTFIVQDSKVILVHICVENWYYVLGFLIVRIRDECDEWI